MKKTMCFILVLAMVCVCCVACGSGLTGEGFELIDDDGTFVKYHLKCESCGLVYSRTHEIVVQEGQPFEAEVNCDSCGERINVVIERKG